MLSVRARRARRDLHQLGDARPRDVRNRHASARAEERRHWRVVGRALGHDRDVASALITREEALGVRVDLSRHRQRPAALGLDDEVLVLGLDLDVGASGAGLRPAGGWR